MKVLVAILVLIILIDNNVRLLFSCIVTVIIVVLWCLIISVATRSFTLGRLIALLPHKHRVDYVGVIGGNRFVRVSNFCLHSSLTAAYVSQ